MSSLIYTKPREDLRLAVLQQPALAHLVEGLRKAFGSDGITPFDFEPFDLVVDASSDDESASPAGAVLSVTPAFAARVLELGCVVEVFGVGVAQDHDCAARWLGDENPGRLHSADLLARGSLQKSLNFWVEGYPIYGGTCASRGIALSELIEAVQHRGPGWSSSRGMTWLQGKLVLNMGGNPQDLLDAMDPEEEEVA